MVTERQNRQRVVCPTFSNPVDTHDILCQFTPIPGSGITTSAPQVVALAPDFDSSTYLTQTLVDPTTILKKKFTTSFWFRIGDADLDRWDIFHAVDNQNSFWTPTFRVTRMASGDNNRLEISAYNSVGSNILNVTSSLGYTLALNPGWHHVVFSADLSKAIIRFYIDGIPVSFTINNFVFNESIPFEISSGPTDEMTYEIGGGIYVMGEQYVGCLAEIWLAPDVFYDLDQIANLRLFITDQLKPANLGLEGKTPLSGLSVSSPLIYLRSSFDVFGTNSGSRGDFTIIGTPGVCFSQPCVGF